MLLDAFSSVVDFIVQVGSYLGLSWIAVAGLSIMLVAFIISFLCTQFSIELRTTRAIEKLNLYLESNPFINDENLVEFNKLMKKIPSPMRVQWQQFMVNRDKKPSEFFSEENCIEKPFKVSSYKNHVGAVRTCLICVSILAFVLSCGALINVGATNLATVLVESLLLSLALYFVGELYILFLKVRRNSSISDLYYNFANFQKYIDRAVTTLPDYVDYEILFTRKEIVSGIPVLQEYLQQRALYEQEQIKKAKESQVEHEHYDFSALGVNGSLIMERAMRECEYYLGNRKRILAEISELEGSRDMLEKSYDEKNKTNQRKLRDIKESLDRLKDKLDSTTNIIVGNDLRKQRENEIQKQRQLEREVDEDNNKFDADKKKIAEEIAGKKAEIEEFRKTAENALNSEFKAYSDKIYTELKDVAEGQVKEELDGVKAENQKLQSDIEERDRCIVEKNAVYDEKLALLDDYSKKLAEQQETIDEASQVKSEAEDKDKEIFEVKKELESRNLELEKKNQEIEKQKELIKEYKRKKQIEVYRYFDANGNEFYVDENNNPYYLDENGNKVYMTEETAESESTEESTSQNEQNVQNTLPVEEEIEEPTNETNVAEESKVEEDAQSETKSEQAPETTSEAKNETAEPVESSNEDALGFSDEDLKLDGDDLQEEPLQENNEQEAEENADNTTQKPKALDEVSGNNTLDAKDLQQQLDEIAKQAEEEDKEKKSAKEPEPEFHKPVYDFVWENSNSSEKFEKEEPVEKEDRKEESAEQQDEIEEKLNETADESSESEQPAETEEKPVEEEKVAEPEENSTESAEEPKVENVEPAEEMAEEATTQTEEPKTEQPENSEVMTEPETTSEASTEEAPVEEQQAEEKQTVEPLEKEKIEEEPAEEQNVTSEELKETESIEDIEKEIQEQNEELEKQHKDLSNQLEETKAIADSEDKKEKKPRAKRKTTASKAKKSTTAKKPTAKKSTTKKTTKKVDDKSADKKPAKKTTPKKKSTAKAKPTSKAKATSKAKSTAKKPTTKKPSKKVTKAQDNSAPLNADEVTVADLSLAQFNEQLKSVMQEINGADGSNASDKKDDGQNTSK